MPRYMDSRRRVAAALQSQMKDSSEPSVVRAQLIRWWGWLVLTTLAVACAISMRYFAAAGLESSAPLTIFRGAMLISHFAWLSAALLAPALLLFLLLPRAAAAVPVGVLCSALILCALLIDTQVFYLYRFHINAGVLNLLFGGAASETFVFPREMYVQAALTFLAVLATVSALGWIAWRYVSRYRPRPGLARSLLAGILLCMLTFHGVHIWADAASRGAIVEQTQVLPMRYAATAKRALRSVGFDVRGRDPLVAAHDGDGGLEYPLRPLDCALQREQPNIVFIVVDSWRFDAIGPHVTPNIDAFARRVVRFEDHYSGGNATRIGIFSLFYSIPGTYWHPMLTEQQRPVFVDELLRRDYELGVFRSAPLFSPEFDRTIFAGMDNVRMRSRGKVPWQWDRDLTDDFKQFVADRDPRKPMFAFLFYDSPHSFDMPTDYAAPFQPNGPRVNYLDLHDIEDPKPFINRYLNSVHYVDSLMGEVFATLESKGLMENSVVVVTGDHGQEFNDSGQNYWGHGSNFTRFQTGVPMLVYAPDLPARVYRHRTSHFDIVPTLLQKYFGCRSPTAEYSVGRSLFAEGGRETLVMSEYADFAIVQPNVIAVVRQHGMDIRDGQYVKLEDRDLTHDALATALEQQRRFFGMAPLHIK